MKKRDDVFILVAYAILSALFAYFLKVNFIWSVILFWIIPSAYLSFRAKPFVRRALIFSAALYPLVFIVWWITEFTQTWTSFPVFDIWLLGFVALEDIPWGFFWVYLPVILYERFFGDEKNTSISPRLKYAFYVLLALLAVFLIIYFVDKQLLDFPYWYLTWGLIFLLVPSIILALKDPVSIGKLAGIQFWLFLHAITFEFVALTLGWWTFEGGQFIATVQAVTGVWMPLEEFVWWFLYQAIGVGALYLLLAVPSKK